MEKRFQEMTDKLSEDLMNVIKNFLFQNILEREQLGDVLNLVLSAHITSLVSSMVNITYNSVPELKDEVVRSMDKLVAYIHSDEFNEVEKPSIYHS